MVGVRMGTPQWHCSDGWREVLPCCASHSNPHGRCLGMIQSPLPSAVLLPTSQVVTLCLSLAFYKVAPQPGAWT